MAKKKKLVVSEPWFDAATNLYRLKIHKFTLESDHRTSYYLRKNELQRIDEKILPKNIKFIVQDESLNQEPELVNVKVILERINVQEFLIKFEESSEVKRWVDKLAMNEYYEQRVDKLKSRQTSVFDLVIQTTYNDQKYFLIQYSVQIADVCNHQILKLVRKATDVVHNSSEDMNSTYYINII
jgi:uncharacterized membrane protein YheB (UPF0754 family)